MLKNDGKPLTAALLGLRLPGISEDEFSYSLSELRLLADTANIIVNAQFTQARPKPDASTYLGKGKLTEIAEALKNEKPDLLIIDHEVTPSQQKNMEKYFRSELSPSIKVIDRTELILLIFAERAHTREAMLQVELAAMKYQLPRLLGMWEHLHRQVAKIGTRGPGETQIEVDRRSIRKKIHFLTRKIEEVKQQRILQRKKRSDNKLPLAAIIGYTNAGKSTLFNLLTGENILAENKLFATLDTTVRKVQLPEHQTMLLTDTVGFIHKLPHALITSFRATLEEITEASFFVHVVDISAPDPMFLIDSVYQVLEELKLKDRPVITLLNKMDLPHDPNFLTKIEQRFSPSLRISLKHPESREKILFLLEEQISRFRQSYTVLVPYDRMKEINLLHEKCNILDKEYRENGIMMEIEVPDELLFLISDYQI